MGLQAPPSRHPGVLVGRVEKHERRVRHGQHRSQGAPVRVLDHGRPRLGVHMEAQRGGVASQGHHPGRAGLERQPGPVLRLTGTAPSPELDPGREPLDDRLGTDPDERRQSDRQPDDDEDQAGRAEHEQTGQGNQGGRGQSGDTGSGEAEQDPPRVGASGTEPRYGEERSWLMHPLVCVEQAGLIGGDQVVHDKGRAR